LRENLAFRVSARAAEALEAVLAGRDVLAVSHGLGKSLLYQLPAMLRIGLVVWSRR